MSGDIVQLSVGSDRPVPVEPVDGVAVVTVESGDTVYYSDHLSVSATANQGSVASGTSQTLTGNAWIISAGRSAVRVVTGSATGLVPSGAQDVIVGSDGKVGGPGGTGLTSSVASGASAASGNPQSIAGIPVTNAQGLRRWRAALADALNTEAPIVWIGDSHTFGQNANGSMTANPADNAADAQLGDVGQLRQLLSRTYGDPGEGFIFSNSARDSRVTAVGGATFTLPTQAPSILHNNYRLTANTQNLTLTMPAGCTRFGVVQSNHSGDAAVTWSQNGASQGAVTAPDGTGVPKTTFLTVNPGDTIVITGPASGQNTILGFSFRTAQTAGVPVHRIGVGGYTQGMMLGGDFNGQLATVDGSTFFSGAEQIANIQAHYKWATNTGLAIIRFATNEQSGQLGVAGIGNGITPAIFATGVQQAVNQIVADGWCVLLLGPNASGSENTTAGAALLTAYSAQLQAIAAGTDHCAFMDLSDLWGGDGSAAKTATASAGLRDAGSSHPTRKGYGDIARHVHRVITGLVPLGN